MPTFKRFMSFTRDSLAEDGKISLDGSSDAAVSWGSWREVLKHDPDSIDFQARSLLINHDPNQIAGPINESRTDGNKTKFDAMILESARLQSGVTVREAVQSGALAGVSIGYSYEIKDAVWDEKTRTRTVNRWMIREVSLTPIPADVTAGVRSCPIDENNQAQQSRKGDHVDFTAWLKGRGLVEAKLSADQITKARAIYEVGGELPADFAGDEAQRALELQQAREENESLKRSLKIRSIADGVNVKLSDEEVKGFRSVEDAQTEIMKRMAEGKGTATPQVAPAQTQITDDKMDKAQRAVENYFLRAARVADQKESQENNPVMGHGLLDSGRRYAELVGISNARNWSRQDMAHFVLGDYRNMSDMARRDAANINSGLFGNFVTANIITKTVARGYEMSDGAVTFQRWTSDREVPDFKQTRIGALGTGRLQKVIENQPLPELEKSEGYYNSQLNMWGGTLSLTVQALINDDTDEFMRSLRRAGSIAMKTIDRRVYHKLLMGTSTSESTSTWTSNTTGSAGIGYTTADGAAAARANLDTVSAALMNKTGLDGLPTGNLPKYLLVAPALQGQARGLMGTGPGQQTTQSGEMEVIVSAWLTAAALISGTLSTTYYLAADPAFVDTMLVSYLRGMRTPQVTQYDAGSVLGVNYKIWLPFEADLIYFTVGSTATIGGAQQGTVA